MEDIEKNLFSNPQWIYIYGAYTDTPFDNEIFDYMNLYPDMASRFKGQFLLSIEYHDVENEE